MQAFWRDLRYGLRGLRNQPGFTILASLTLALGIGAATTIFSVIHGVLLDPFPYTDPGRVVTPIIRDQSSSRPGGRNGYQTAEYLDLEEQNRVFEEVIGGSFEDILLTTGEGTEQFNGGLLTPNTFRFLGVPALWGRTMTPDDAKPGAPPVFVMSHKMWVRNYNQDRSILGRVFVLNGVPTTLVGIMPKRFTKLGADLWKPVALSRADKELANRFFMFQARLKPGVTIAQAEADVNAVTHSLAKIYPRNYPEKFTVKIETWLDSLVGQFRRTLYTLAAAVALLLLIACANVANMLLARATAREKEMAVRAAMGASRGRLVSQMLTESLLLALLGAAIGCLFAYGGIQALVALIPDGAIPREAEIRLNLPVLLFSLGAAVFTALLFGLMPALHAAKRDIVDPLKDSGKGVSGGFRHGKLRNALVVVEVALSLVLLAGAGLLMRSFVKLTTVDLGFNPENILVARIPLPRGQYTTAADKQRFFRQALQRIHGLPGVIAATETSTLPPYGGIRSEIEIPGKVNPEKWHAIFQLCSEGYIPTLGLKVLSGRGLSEVEVNDARRVAVVNETLVKRFFGSQSPLGQRVRIKFLETFPAAKVENPVFEIVGVVADAKNQGLQEPVMPELFLPYTTTGAFERGILVRTAVPPLSLLKSVRGEIWAVDRNVALTLTGSLTDYLKQFSYAGPRFALILLGVFAGVGLVLVIIGVFSVISYTVTRQTHEIGIRTALGAGRSDVLSMVLRMGLRLIAAGIVLGALASIGVGRLITTQLWGVSPHDPLTLAGVVAVVAAAGIAASYFPARRAATVDPIVALRYE
jgi:putative ABC transport system permease protein